MLSYVVLRCYLPVDSLVILVSYPAYLRQSLITHVNSTVTRCYLCFITHCVLAYVVPTKEPSVLWYYPLNQT